MLKTKQATIEHTKKILHSNIDKELIGEDLSFILSILPRHPEYKEKSGVGIKTIRVKRTAFNSPCFFIERMDGTFIDFSYKTCINGKSIEPKDNLNEAMRAAVKEQIIEFKKFNLVKPFKCPLCSSFIEDDKKIHVDHVNKFRYLSHCFKISHECPDRFDDDPVFNNAIFREIDNEIKDKWKNYHKQYAILRLICNSCNQKEG